MQIDSVHLNVDEKKRYLINAIDIKGRLAFSYEYKRLNSKNVVDFFKRAKKYFPFKIKRIQTDNGKEFKGQANRYLNKSNLIHYLNLPRSPQTNEHIERFNRVIKEQFVYRNEEYLSDCDIVNQKIKDYLFWYNTQKYHKSLNYETPIIYTLAHLNRNKFLQTLLLFYQKCYILHIDLRLQAVGIMEKEIRKIKIGARVYF